MMMIDPIKTKMLPYIGRLRNENDDNDYQNDEDDHCLNDNDGDDQPNYEENAHGEVEGW